MGIQYLPGMFAANIADIAKKPLPIPVQPDNLNIPKRPVYSLEQASLDLMTKGISEDQKEAYKQGISEALYQNVNPVEYGKEQIPNIYAAIKQWVKGDKKKTSAFEDMFILNENPDLAIAATKQDSAAIKKAHKIGNDEDRRTFAPSDDAWRLYLGLPQKNGTFSISEYKPNKEEEGSPYYYKLNNFWGKFIDQDSNSVARLIKIINTPRHAAYAMGLINDPKQETMGDNDPTLGRYKISLGKDKKGNYISYYDKWDLTPDIKGTIGKLVNLLADQIGKPLEIYDRLYYDPKTFKPINQPIKDVDKETLHNLFNVPKSP